MISAQRRGLPPLDAESNGMHHWTVMAALALAVVGLAVLASLGTHGWRIPAVSAALAALVWGLSSVRAPTAAGAEGSRWAIAAIAWALAVLAATVSGRSLAKRKTHAQEIAGRDKVAMAAVSNKPNRDGTTRPPLELWLSCRPPSSSPSGRRLAPDHDLNCFSRASCGCRLRGDFRLCVSEVATPPSPPPAE